MQDRKLRGWTRLIQAASVIAIVVATMTPSSDRSASPFLCVLCGEHAITGLLLNVVLFLPLGAVLGWSGWGLALAALFGAGLSSLIEGAQFFIPGRESALGDILANTTGTVIGAGLWRLWPDIARPTGTRRFSLAAVATGVAVGAQVLVALLVAPAFPRSIYFGQWTPELMNFGTYHGYVTSAGLHGLQLPSRRLNASATVRELLLAGERLEVTAVAKATFRGPSTLFSIADDKYRFILMVLVDGHDIVIRYRSRAEALGLTPPELRLAGAMYDVPDDSAFTITVADEHARWCVAVGHRSECQGLTTGGFWRFLTPSRARARPVLDALWMACLFVPVGYYAVGRRMAFLFVLAIAPALVLPFIVDGVVFSAVTPLGAAIGLAVGRVVDVALTRRSLRAGTRPA